jgi:hypothetical protein
MVKAILGALLICYILHSFASIFRERWALSRDLRNAERDVIVATGDLVNQWGAVDPTVIPAPRNYLSGSVSCANKPYWCPDGAECNCRQICDSENAELLSVEEDDSVVFMGEKLTAGRYCVPGSLRHCWKSASRLVFDGTKWTCSCTHPTIFEGENCSNLVACQLPFLKTNNGNVLWDYLTDRPVDKYSDRDFYEKLQPEEDGRMRYRCMCGGKDDYDNPLLTLPEMPLHCFVDYCKSSVVRSAVPGFDYETGACDCGDFNLTRQKHEITDDPSSQCTSCYTRYERGNDTLRLKLPCYNRLSLVGSKIPDYYPCTNYASARSDCSIATIQMKFGK